MMEQQKNIYDRNSGSDQCDIYETYRTALRTLCDQHSIIREIPFGKSYIGREIPAVQLGEGGHRLLYVGGVTGSVRTTALLLRFIRDYACAVRDDRRVAGIDVSYLYHTRAITVVPMLNPDGAVLRAAGEAGDPMNPLLDRLHEMRSLSAETTDGDSGEENLFSAWETNGRGVDLRCNYDAQFEICMQSAACIGGRGYSGMHPESEPECAAVARYLRAAPVTDLAMMFYDESPAEDGAARQRKTNGRIAWSGDHRTRSVAQIIAKDIDGKAYDTDNAPVPGSLKDWYQSLRSGPLLEITVPGKWDSEGREENAARMLLCAACTDGGGNDGVHAQQLPVPGETLAQACLTLGYGKLRKVFFHGAVL